LGRHRRQQLSAGAAGHWGGLKSEWCRTCFRRFPSRNRPPGLSSRPASLLRQPAHRVTMGELSLREGERESGASWSISLRQSPGTLHPGVLYRFAPAGRAVVGADVPSRWLCRRSGVGQSFVPYTSRTDRLQSASASPEPAPARCCRALFYRYRSR